MVSNTKQTERRRRIKAATVGRAQKKDRARAGTPKFPIHPEGVETVAGASAASASKATAPKAAAAAKPAAAPKAAAPAPAAKKA